MIKDKVFVVTGGGNGMGREVVLNLLKRGAKVAALDMNANALAETVTLSGKSNNLKTYELNVTDLEKVEKVKDEILKDFKQIDGLLHVAGIIQPFVKVLDLTMEQIKKVIDVNFYGTVNMNQTFLPEILKAPKGYLVNVSSMGGFIPVPGQAVYGASKAAVKLFTEALYSELKGTNVIVSLVFPGAIKTNITGNSLGVTVSEEEASESKHKMTLPKDAAEMIVKGMLKGKLYNYVGKDSKMLNRIYRLAPRKATNLIANKMGDLLN